jgi:DHA1 family bicyclomycin/chloramphenicol resistance-like MFS transporter
MTQMILSANFLGICIASLFYGPISDCLGRRKPLIAAQIIFTIGAIGALLSNSINLMIFWRFTQGIGSAGMIIISGAIIFDLFEREQVIKLVAIWNSLGTGCMASAPLFGGLLNQYFGWRSNFLLILIVSLILLISTIIFFKESLKEKYHHKMFMQKILQEYFSLVCNFPYVANSVICALMYSGIMVYTSSLSLLFINYYHISEQSFIYYQFSTMFSFALFSIVCAKTINIYGAEKTKKIGIWLCNIGAISLLLVGYFKSTSPVLICASMAIFNAGVAFAIGIFGVYSMEFFPKLKATAGAMGTSFRLFFTTIFVTISAHSFNGTIRPICWIIAILALIIYFLYLTAQKPTLKLLKKIR